MNYRVMWEEVVAADSFRHAAELADQMQRRRGRAPKKFEITSDEGEFQPVALEQPDVGGDEAVRYRAVAEERQEWYDDLILQVDADAEVDPTEGGAWVQAWVWVDDADVAA